MRKLLSLIGLLFVFGLHAQEQTTATFNGVTAQELQKKIAQSEARMEAKIVKSMEKAFQLQMDKTTANFQKKINNLSYVNTKQAQQIESQAATIAALENQIRSMGGKLTQVETSNNAQNQNISDMGTSVTNLEITTNEKVDTINAKITSITTFWAVALVVVLALGIALFVGLNKKVKTAKETIDQQLRKTEDLIKEDGWDRFHDKLVKFMAMRKS